MEKPISPEATMLEGSVLAPKMAVGTVNVDVKGRPSRRVKVVVMVANSGLIENAGMPMSN